MKIEKSRISSDPKILILIPCHNESISIPLTIKRCFENIPDAEIVVIDNASSDDTAEVAKRHGVRVIFEPNQGKGFAVRRGFSELKSHHEAILMIDGDDTYGLENFVEGLKLIGQGHDMVIGRRIKFHEDELATGGGHYRRGHQLGNAAFSRLFKLFFGIQITDPLSGWRLMNPKFVKSFSHTSGGFEIETELNAHAFLLKSAIKEIEVNYFSRVEGSNSKLSTYRDGLKILRRNLKLFRSEKPATAFSILALPWLILSSVIITQGIVGYWQTDLVPKFPRLVAAFTLFIVSSLLWVTGMILDRIRLNREVLVRYEYSRK